MNYSWNQQTLILSIQYIKDSMFGLVYTVGNKTDLVPIANAIDSPDCSGLTPVPQRLPTTNTCDSAMGTVHRGRANANALNPGRTKCPQPRQDREVTGKPRGSPFHVSQRSRGTEPQFPCVSPPLPVEPPQALPLGKLTPSPSLKKLIAR